MIFVPEQSRRPRFGQRGRRCGRELCLVRRQGKRGREGYRERKKLGVHAAAFQADQGDPAQAQGLIQSVIERFGRLDILVNNATVAWQGKTIDSHEIDNAAKRRRGGFAFIEGQSRTIIRD